MRFVVEPRYVRALQAQVTPINRVVSASVQQEQAHTTHWNTRRSLHISGAPNRCDDASTLDIKSQSGGRTNGGQKPDAVCVLPCEDLIGDGRKEERQEHDEQDGQLGPRGIRPASQPHREGM